MYDVIVVGARVAGSPTATLLVRKGYKVLRWAGHRSTPGLAATAAGDRWAAHPPTLQDQQLFGALRTNQPAAERCLSTIAGSVPIPEFFAESNLSNIIGESLPLAA